MKNIIETYSEQELREEVSLKNNFELKKLIAENPEAPLLIFVGEDAYAYSDFTYTSCKSSSPCLEELTLYKEEWINKEDFRERLEWELDDFEEYKSLSDEEYQNKVDEIVNNTSFITAIVLYLG